MIKPEKMCAGRLAAMALFCLMLGACSTTQKSSTVTGSAEAEQPAAPVSEAGAGPSASSAPTTASAPASSSAPETQELPVFPETRATPIEGEEAQAARQQLAEQDAEITRLREEQAAARQLAEEDAAQRQALESAAAQQQAIQPGAAPAAGAAASPDTGASSASSASRRTAAATAAIGLPEQRSVYFDFDKAAVSPEYDQVVAVNAAFLKANPDFTVVIQGNCDERGSREYNLALGQRRAEMVKRALELSGVNASRITTVSFGAEKPVASGRDEASYRLNRRADIVY